MNPQLNEQITATAYRLKHLLKEREKLLVSWLPERIPPDFPSTHEICDDQLLNEAIASFLESLGWLLD